MLQKDGYLKHAEERRSGNGDNKNANISFNLHGGNKSSKLTGSLGNWNGSKTKQLRTYLDAKSPA